MRELIASVASILNDLETLKLLEKKNLDTSVEMDANTHKYVLIVSIQSDDDILSFYLEIFRTIRDKHGFGSMAPCEFKNGVATFKFFEQ